MMTFPIRSFPAYTNYPAVADVRSGTAYHGVTGTLDLPDVPDVELGVVYDNGTKTGTLVVTGGGGSAVKGWGTGTGWS